jgi:hypothetical protein
MRSIWASAAFVLFGLAAPAALADSINANTVVRVMTCTNGAAVTVEYERPATSAALPNTFRVVDSTTTFAWRHLLLLSPSGETIVDSSTGLQGAERNQTLVTCSFVSSTTGNTFVLTGFFTPAQ